MYLRVLNQPNLVGTVLITVLFCAGFVYAVAFDGFNIETVTGGDVDAWLAAASSGGSGTKTKDCDNSSCNPIIGGFAGCPGNGCTDCEKKTPNLCDTNCKQGHQGCGNTGSCPYNAKGSGYCSNGQAGCPDSCNKK